VKVIRVCFVAAFVVLLLMPLVFFNVEPESVSLIDNRKLAENPFTAAGDIRENFENYLSDRIGFRDDMIRLYTVANDRLFGKMVHPSYTYGKDGYVFGAGVWTGGEIGDFHAAFADMVLAIQEYCESRGVPFLFVFDPAKPAIYQDKLADGVNYNREWVDQFLAEMEARGINYLDNTVTLSELVEDGIHGFNQKYDANHWNATGAFYGTRAMLECLYEMDPSVHVNELNEFSVSETLQTTLHVSEFPIYEYVPEIWPLNGAENMTSNYADEVYRHPSHPGFGYYRNQQRLDEGAPRALVFQGSYMNEQGYKFLMNAFGEYIYVHDYQNVIDFPYYFNIFQPECVIFEVGEYTIAENYFSYEAMTQIQYHPSISTLPADAYMLVEDAKEQLIFDTGEALTTVFWQTDNTYSYVWLKLDAEYDMQPVEGGYQAVVDASAIEMWNDEITVIVSQ